MRSPSLLLVLLSLLSAPAAWAEQPVEFALTQFPPYFQLDRAGRPNGPMVELAEVLFETAGLPLEIRSFPPARLQRRIADGQTQVTVAAEDHPILRESALRTSVPLISLELRSYHKPNRHPVYQLTDLRDYSIITINAYPYGSLLERLQNPALQLQLINAHSHGAALQMLLHERADYLINYAGPMNELLRPLPPNTLLSERLELSHIYLFVGNAGEQSQHLRDRLDRALVTLHGRGEIRRILGPSAPLH